MQEDAKNRFADIFNQYLSHIDNRFKTNNSLALKIYNQTCQEKNIKPRTWGDDEWRGWFMKVSSGK